MLAKELAFRSSSNGMQSKGAIALLVLVALGLGTGLLVRDRKARTEKQTDVSKIVQLSNTVVETQSRFEEQRLVNLTLSTNLAGRETDLATFSNRVVSTSADLARAQTDAKAAAEAAASEMAKRDAKISDLQGQNDDMTKKMSDLNASLSTLEKQITDTQRKLAASEGDREFLLKELKRLQTEKAELERQFNDLAALRDQVRRLRDELSIARRLEWIRQGIYGNQTQKGGEKLMQDAPADLSKITNNTVRIDLKQDGSVKVAPPTNAPPKK